MNITDNVNPTNDDVREWGYDEDLFLMEQDEDLLLYGTEYVPVLLELARDPACPKREYAIAILGQFVREAALSERIADLIAVGEVVDGLPESLDTTVGEWRDYVRRLLSYRARPFPVNEPKGYEMAHDLLLCIGRQGNLVRNAPVAPDVLHFSLTTSYPEHLLISRRTGAFTHGRWKMPAIP